MTTTDNRITGAAHDSGALLFLHRFGWLTAKMLAAIQWSQASQGEAMARRTLRRLLDAKLVLKRETAGNVLWVLSAAGARALREQFDLDASSGQTLKLAQVMHRACANWYAISKLAEKFTVWTEYEIQTGRAPWGKLDGKTADMVYDSGQGLVFCEVENAWKNRKHRSEIERLCRLHLSHENGLMTPLAGGHYLARMAVVGTNETALRMMQQTFVEALDAGHLRDAHCANVEFTFLPITASLDVGPGWTRQLWADILLPTMSA